MRLTVLPLQQITPELCHDLAKLALPEGVECIESWLNELLAKPQQQVWLARFNDKYIGLLLMTTHEQFACVDWLEVREATRRRGVGRYLLEQAIEQQQGLPVKVLADRDGATLLQGYGFLAALGFDERSDGSWQR